MTRTRVYIVPGVRFRHDKGQECLLWLSSVLVGPPATLEVLLPAPGCPVMPWVSRSEQLEPDAAGGGESRAEQRDSQAPCLLLQPTHSLPQPLSSLPLPSTQAAT